MVTFDEMTRKFDEVDSLLGTITGAMASRHLMVVTHDGTRIVDETERIVQLLSVVSLKVAFLSTKVKPT